MLVELQYENDNNTLEETGLGDIPGVDRFANKEIRVIFESIDLDTGANLKNLIALKRIQRRLKGKNDLDHKITIKDLQALIDRFNKSAARHKGDFKLLHNPENIKPLCLCLPGRGSFSAKSIEELTVKMNKLIEDGKDSAFSRMEQN